MQNRFTHKLFKLSNLVAFILLMCLVTPSFAMDVTLQWDANTETDRAGYRIYFDTAPGPPYEGIGATEGDAPIDVKIADVEAGDTAEYTVTGLDDDEIYFFTVTAYNTRGNESGYSNEVSTGSDISTGTESASSGGSGCFISTLKP